MTGKKKQSMGLGKIIGLAVLATIVLLLLVVGFLIGTKTGRRLMYQYAAKYIYQSVEVETEPEEKQTEVLEEAETETTKPDPWYDEDEPVRNFLIYGVEEIGGAKNTDTMMIASINMDTGEIKLTSILRDTMVQISGYRDNKLNQAFALGGVELLLETIEHNYMIDIDGYAWVNFESFEEVIDLIGGIDLELTTAEANYLNTTNYISKPENRNVSPGMNHLNGNQVLGYCRVRYVRTSTDGHDDYGRTERQRLVLNTIFNTYIKRNPLDLMTLSKKCLKYINTSVSEEQIAQILECVVEKRANSLETFQVPINGYFSEPKEYNGVTYPLILDWEENILQYYQFLFGDTEEEAKNRYETYKTEKESRMKE
ncbi:MAG: LCP family protein [Lachnospiraceae bacterium]|nr:LCP family protein [Lachnospiraceae bacterium]